MAFGQTSLVLPESWGDAPGYDDQWPSAKSTAIQNSATSKRASEGPAVCSSVSAQISNPRRCFDGRSALACAFGLVFRPLLGAFLKLPALPGVVDWIARGPLSHENWEMGWRLPLGPIPLFRTSRTPKLHGSGLRANREPLGRYE